MLKLKSFQKKFYSGKSLDIPNNKSKHLVGSNIVNKSILPKTNHLSKSLVNYKPLQNLKINHTGYKLGNNNYIFNITLDASVNQIKPCAFICALDVSGSMDEPSTKNDVEASKFSRLDLVQHSMNTIVHSLRPEDSLAVITFSDTGDKLLSLSNMDAQGKKEAFRSIKNMSAGGSTNLWSGLNMSMDELNKLDDSVNKFGLLLTDGEPNINPNRGILYEFVNSSQFNGSLNTFGYGYNNIKNKTGLDSKLLHDLARLGGGLFAHIPDHSMCNTVFINFLSNCLSVAINKVTMEYTNVENCGNISIVGNNMNDILYNNKNMLNVGPIQSGQTQNILLNAQIDDIDDFEIKLKFTHDGQITTHIINNKNMSNDMNNNNIKYQITKTMLIENIESGMENMDLIKTCEKLDNMHATILNSKNTSQEIMNLAKNIKHVDINDGQIHKAFSNEEWFKRWGIHYLRYFMRSHQLQVCSNFKDASLQNYGGKLFKEIKEEVEEIFNDIPVPTPSRSSQPFTGNYSQTFYSSSGPCFEGSGKVQIVNKATLKFDELGQQYYYQIYNSHYDTKLVSELKKGDQIVNSDGNVCTILCVIRTKSGLTEFIDTVRAQITPWHPIRVNGSWVFPMNIYETSPKMEHFHKEVDYVYNFILDQHHIITINGLDAITLGHDMENGILKHPYFGTTKIIDDIKTKRSDEWENGLVTIESYKPVYDENGLVSSIF